MITAFELLFLGGLITAFTYALRRMGQEETEARKRIEGGLTC